MKLCLNTISFVSILIYIFSLFVFFSYIYITNRYYSWPFDYRYTEILYCYIGDGENNMDNEQQYSLNLRTPDPLIIDITSTSMATTWEEWTSTLEI